MMRCSRLRCGYGCLWFVCDLIFYVGCLGLDVVEVSICGFVSLSGCGCGCDCLLCGYLLDLLDLWRWCGWFLGCLLWTAVVFLHFAWCLWFVVRCDAGTWFAVVGFLMVVFGISFV